MLAVTNSYETSAGGCSDTVVVKGTTACVGDILFCH